MTHAQARDTEGGRVRILRIFTQTVESVGERVSSLSLIKKAGIGTRKSASNPWRHTFGSAVERVNGWPARLPT